MDEPRDYFTSDSEVSQRNISYDNIYMWNLKKNDTNDLIIYKTRIYSQTSKTNFWLPKGKGEGRNKLGDRRRARAAETAHRAQPRGATPRPWSGAEARRTPCLRGGGWEEQPHIQGAVAAWAPEGLEDLFHIQGREGWLLGDTPRPR